MKTWLDPQTVTVPDDLAAAVGGHRVVLESLVRRGYNTVAAAQQFLNPDAYHPTPPDELPDMDKAVHRLRKAIKGGESILIWGDFDVDGQTSTALLVSALRDLGAKDVRYHVPNRFTEGHGIHLPTLQGLLSGVGVLLTCDTGIAAHESVAYAMRQGVDVIITDHHSLPDVLPQAYAAINPMRLPEGHALRELPGVGTAYKVMQALYGNTSSDHLLDLVALGIVADVMVQVDDTRYLLQRGLDKLRDDPRPGIRAMMKRAGIEPQHFNEMDIGFSLGPRLNALGRLADANPAVELLTTDDSRLIEERVNELEGLNQERRYLTRQVHAAALQQIQADDSLLKYAALVVSGEGWHKGVVGIVASRLVEEYAAPVIVLSEGDVNASGSARSVAGVNIVEAIRSQKHLLDGYGGHSMAAGMSLPKANLFEFRRGISSVVREMLGKAEVQPELTIDAYINLAEIDLDFAGDITRLAPFGNGNPALTLATKNVKVTSQRTLGSRSDHLDLKIEDEAGNQQRVLWWFGDLDSLPQGNFDLAYTVRKNTFRGKTEAMVEWLDARPVQGQALEIQTGPRYDVVDWRDQPPSAAMLSKMLAQYPDALIWAEGDAPDAPTRTRYELTPADTFIVWALPPDVFTWQAALRTVQPQTLILFGNEPRFPTPKALLTQMVGMAKYALAQKNGWISMTDFVRATGHSERTLRVAMQWVAARTAMHFTEITDDDFLVEMAAEAQPQKVTSLEQRLATLMTETAAYRKHWRNQSFR